MKKMTCAFAVLLATAAAPVLAQSYLSKDDLQRLINGNTVHTEDLVSGRSFLAYHHPGGRWQLQRQDGSVVEGTWSIRADGAQCVVIDTEICGLIQKHADGTYTRMVGGAPRNRWSKVSDGKSF